jgi:hypothetical protein
MRDARIVVGAGPDALDAAAELAATGAPVTVLLAPESERSAVIERVATRGLALEGRVVPLPMRKRDLVRLLGDAAPTVLADYARARLARLRRQLAGVGVEERTYEDWVRRRMGGAAHDHLYAAYAVHRFGAPSHELSVSVARVHHWGPAPAPASPADARGVEVRWGSVRQLVVEAGRVRRIELDDGSIDCDGLWIARSPSTIAQWLGDALEPALRVDAQRLIADSEVRVVLAGNLALDEIHVLDRDAPFFRVRRTPEGAAFHLRVPPGNPVHEAGIVDAVSAAAAKLGSFSTQDARFAIAVDSAPRWLAGTHARLRRVLAAWSSLGIAGVGRSGTMSLVDRATEIAFARALARGEADQRELHRRLLDPPVRADDLDAKLLRFVER